VSPDPQLLVLMGALQTVVLPLRKYSVLVDDQVTDHAWLGLYQVMPLEFFIKQSLEVAE
jgi:hypothetical protein